EGGEGVMVGGCRRVGKPVGVRDRHRVGLGLEELLGAAMKVADVRLRLEDLLSVPLQDEAQHAVGRGMLGPEVQLHLLDVEQSRNLGVFYGRLLVVHRRRSKIQNQDSKITRRSSGSYSWRWAPPPRAILRDNWRP